MEGSRPVSDATSSLSTTFATPARVVVVDDHPVIQLAVMTVLQAQPQFQVVGCATNGADALQLVADHAPHLLVLDVSMPGMPIADVLMQLRERSQPDPRVLLFTSYGQVPFIQDMLRLGAHGYMLKEERLELLLAGLDVLLAGKQWLSPAVVRLLNARLLNAEAPEGRSSPDLTRRELQMLHLLAQGLNNAEIAQTLGRAEQTVRNTLTIIYAKIDAQSRSEALLWAQRHLTRSP